MKVVGKNVNRVDALAKATGWAKFTVDIHPDNMGYVKVLRSPWAHAKILSIDESGAKKIPGIWAILTNDEMCGMPLHNNTIDNRVRYVGEAIAAVLAVSEDAAEAAIEEIKVEYQKLPEYLTPEEAMAENAMALWDGGNICGWAGPHTLSEGCSIAWEKGSIDKGFEESDIIAEYQTDTHAQFHGALEPHACVASWDSGMKHLTMYISSQGVFEDQSNIARSLGLLLDQVDVKCPFVGGGFGGKAHNTCKEYVMSALLSQKTGRPASYTPTRSEEAICAARHPSKFSYKIGAKNDGTIAAISMEALRSGGAYTSLQMNFMLGSTEYVAPTYLKSPNVRYEGNSVYTNMPLCAAFRGFGYFESGAAFAQAVDMAAEKLNMNPVDFLLKNVPREGDPVSTDQGPLTTAGVYETVEACAKAINWENTWHKPGMKRLPDGRLHGIGIAHAMGRATLPSFVTSGNAYVQVKKDGSVRVFAGVTDIGQGQATGLVQITAEALGVPFESVGITWGDTAAPHTGDQVASSTTMMTGNAVKLAADDAREQILEIASKVMKAAAEDLFIENGIISIKETAKSAQPEEAPKKMTLSQVVEVPGVKGIQGRGNWSITDAQASPRSLVVCAVEVAVDTETGNIQILNMVQGTDCGRAISKSRVSGQMDAVLSGGLGYILYEDWAVDRNMNGRIMNLNFYDYKMPTFSDFGEVLQPNIIIECPDRVGPFGARGMGEATLSASAPAVLNAVYNALGIRFDSTPLSQGRVLKELARANIYNDKEEMSQ